MKDFQTLVGALRAMSLTQVRELSLRTAVPIHTLMKIRSGETANPRVKTVEAIGAALCSEDAKWVATTEDATP